MKRGLQFQMQIKFAKTISQERIAIQAVTFSALKVWKTWNQIRKLNRFLNIRWEQGKLKTTISNKTLNPMKVTRRNLNVLKKDTTLLQKGNLLEDKDQMTIIR